jgi:hypothetical protein
METSVTADALIRALAREFRVVSLGGVAVIAHGLDRNTHAADIWLDPLGSSARWAEALKPFLYNQTSALPVAIAVWEPIPEDALAGVAEVDGVFRVNGLDRPLDIFRRPNELDEKQFHEVWERAKPMEDGTRLPDPIDLLVTKMLTDREKDLQDIAFLEAKVEKDYLARLPAALSEEAVFMLHRFLSPKVAAAAMQHPSAEVRSLAYKYLLEMEAEGNPFARDILRSAAGFP